jgi:hypothetical protein
MKLKITKEQYQKLLINEQESRSKLLTEATHEVTLVIASLGGLKLSGMNDTNVKKNLKNIDTLNLVKSTLEDSDKVKDLVKSLEEKGMKDPNGFLSNNAEKIIKNYNTYNEKNKLDFLAKSNLKDLTSE